MRHQIKFLITAIIVFAAFATSALKADDIEGTWSQDGQYKKFSKQYSNSILSTVSEDGKKMAFIVNDTLRIVEIATGILLDTCYLRADIPQTDTTEAPSYSLSNNFSYIACRFNDRHTNDTILHFMEDLLIRKLDNRKIIIDTSITYNINELNSYSSLSSISPSFSGLFICDSIFCSFLEISATFAMRTEYNYKYSFAFNCETKQKLTNTPFSNYSNIKRTNNGKNLLASSHTLTYTKTPYDDITRIDENEFIFGYYNNIYHPISYRSWFYSNNPRNPGKSESWLYPIGITPDCKTAIISNSDREINLYSLVNDSPEIKLTDSTGNTKFPQIASPVVLFPNNVNSNKLLYISRFDQLTLFSTLNYFTGATNNFGFSGKDYIVNSQANFMIDSNRILSISDTNEIYLLDLDNVIPVNNLDIYSDFQSVSTNDEISFVAIYPESYRNILIDFGDGSTSTASNVKHKYSQSGKYTITLTAKDSLAIEHKIVKNEYITVEQGVTISMKLSVEYLSNNQFRINLKSYITGEHYDTHIYIADSSALDVDSLSAVFSGTGYYYVKTTCIDSQFNKLITKDTAIKVYGPEDDRILTENYSSYYYYDKIYIFKNNTGYQVFDSKYPITRAISIDTNFRITQTNTYDDPSYYWSSNQISNSNYFLSISSSRGGAYGFYDSRKDKPFNNIYASNNNSAFAFSDDTLGMIDITTNEIVLKSFNDTSGINRIQTNIKFNSQPLVVNNFEAKKVFLMDNSPDQGITLYSINQDYHITKINTIDAVYQPNYIIEQSLKTSINNIFEFIESDKIITLNFNTGVLRTHSLPNLKIQQVVHISNSQIALIGVDSNSIINVCLVDSNYVVNETIKLPYRTSGPILFAEKNKQNQLDFVSYTTRGILYFCTVKISNDTGSVIDTTNSSKLLLNEVSRYPNPASNSITIDYPLSTDASILIADEKGKTIKARIISKNDLDFTIDTSLLPEGMYFVQIRDGDINKSVKFMVKR